jgi:hypothetical protein
MDFPASRLDRGIGFHWHTNQAKADRAFPNCTCHNSTPGRFFSNVGAKEDHFAFGERLASCASTVPSLIKIRTLKRSPFRSAGVPACDIDIPTKKYVGPDRRTANGNIACGAGK